MKINHAILHIFDAVACVNTFSQMELDLSAKPARQYVTSHAKRTLGNLDAKRGTFSGDSMFAEELRAYFRGGRDFVDLSLQVAEFVIGELLRADTPVSSDVLVVDFEADPDSTVRDMTDEEAEAAFEARGKRYFALVVLESKQAYMHEAGFAEDGTACNTVVRHRAILPNPSQKVASFALVEEGSLAVSFCDKPRAIAGEERLVIPDGLLQCSVEASSKEVFQEVARLVEEVAEEFGANTAVAVAKTKAYVAENAEDADEVYPEELAREVFGEGSPCEQRFREAAVADALPERVVVERAVAKRVAKSHKIRTDTGIELTFPAEYGENPDFIEFVNEPDGRISIQLKNIAHIENR